MAPAGKATSATTEFSKLIIIGAGVSGIATAVYYKRKFGEDYTIYEKAPELGGTWWVNTYPGCAVDIPAMFYSFSFEPKYDWSHFFPNQAELLEYSNSTAVRWGVRPKIRFSTEVERAEWVEETKRWRVYLRRRKVKELEINETTGVQEYEDEGESWVHECKVLISCVGTLAIPKKCDIPGHEEFQGHIFHSARWNHNADTAGKNVIVVGNGCSAAQLVPEITPTSKSVVQFMRSAQWMMPRPNPPLFGTNERFAKHGEKVFKYIPFIYKITRFLIFLAQESWFLQFKTTRLGNRERQAAEKCLSAYMRSQAPNEYWDLVLPKYKLGCKRRVLDDGYLANLAHPNMKLTNDPISKIEGNHVVTEAGVRYPADVIVLANGFDVRQGLSPLPLIGKDGESLSEHWKKLGGPAAYNTCCIDRFPNFFMAFGPNSVTGHSSVLMASEGIAEFAMKVSAPVFRGEADEVEVKREAREEYVDSVQRELKNMIWSNMICRSWYLNESGLNYVTYPFSQFHFLYRCMFPAWKDWTIAYTPSYLRRRRVKRFALTAVLTTFGVWAYTRPGAVATVRERTVEMGRWVFAGVEGYARSYFGRA